MRRGALALSSHWPGQIVGCPGTIDNDLMGTDYTIGFSTAVQTAVDAVDKIRDTAESHDRMFLVEVMGRHSGYIAVYTALAAAGECVCIPETPTDIDDMIRHLKSLKERGKTSVIMVVAEGDEESVRALGRWCRKGPSMAVVHVLDEDFEEYRGEFEGFRITW